MMADKEDPLAGKPLVLFYTGSKAPVEVKPQAGPHPASQPLTVLGLANIVQGSDPLQLAPRVRFEGGTYDVSQAEGLYRFIKMPNNKCRDPGLLRNLICVNSLGNTSSLIALLGGVSLLHVHGTADQPPLDQGLIDLETPAVTQAWLSITCAYVSDFGIKVLDDIGVTARKVNVVTTLVENGYDDGHTVMEMLDPSTDKWVLADLDLGYVFRDYKTGHYLSVDDFLNTVLKNNKPEFVALSNGDIDPFWIENGFNYSPWFKWRLATADDRWEWYRRVFRVINK